MADSTEQKLITAILARMALVDGTGNYQTTVASDSIADSRPNWDESDFPAISVFQGPVEPEDRDDEAQKVYRKMNVLIKGFLKRGTDASNARKMLADFHRAIRSGDEKWTVAGTPLAHRTDEGPHRIEYAEGTYEVVGVEQEIDIYYIGSKFDLEA